MQVIKKEFKLCPCCMEEHEVVTIKVQEENIFKGTTVEYEAIYKYCERADEMYVGEDMLSLNDIAMKDAYRSKNGLLTSQQICGIRKKYEISQTDLSTILGLGAKTITRYEGHQVQDVAYDKILRKINDDPEWFLQLLNQCREKFASPIYQKYQKKAEEVFNRYSENYLEKTLLSKYAEINGDSKYCGGTPLNIAKIKDIIQYFSQSKDVTALFKVKLMKLLWYADNLSFKRHGCSLTGLAYQRNKMGALPVGHNFIMALDGVHYEEIEYGDQQVGYKFLPMKDYIFTHLREEDLVILDDVIKVCGRDTKDEIVTRMHNEIAYLKTAEKAIIDYHYASALSLN